jgi:hypothetical protein
VSQQVNSLQWLLPPVAAVCHHALRSCTAHAPRSNFAELGRSFMATHALLSTAWQARRAAASLPDVLATAAGLRWTLALGF